MHQIDLVEPHLTRTILYIKKMLVEAINNHSTWCLLEAINDSARSTPNAHEKHLIWDSRKSIESCALSIQKILLEHTRACTKDKTKSRKPHSKLKCTCKTFPHPKRLMTKDKTTSHKPRSKLNLYA